MNPSSFFRRGVKESENTAMTMDESDSMSCSLANQHMYPDAAKTPVTKKTRSFSDGGGTPAKLSPSPHIIEGGRRTSKDDNHIPDALTGGFASSSCPEPVTPRRPNLQSNGLSTQVSGHFQHPAGGASPVLSAAGATGSFSKPPPLSPQLGPSQIYASPTNILPRRSRGLDFSRAATSLHHSTLAESSPESSPTLAGRGMNIPGRRSNDYGQAEQSSTSLWSVVGGGSGSNSGTQERNVTVSSSVGSSHALVSDSSSSDDDDLMDEDTEEAYVTTPQINRTNYGHGILSGGLGSPAVSSLMSFQQRQRPRKQPKKKARGPLGLGFNSPSASGAIAKSPPSKDVAMSHARRESISWQANQLHISGSEEERSGEGSNGVLGGSGAKRQTIMRQVATRRGNLMPKTKNFARIKHALLEEGAPVESEVRREAEVIRQVRDSDVDLEPRVPSTQASPSLPNQDTLDDIVPAGDEMIPDHGLSSSFKQQAIKNSKGPKFWDTFSETSSIGTRTTPPPPASGLPRGSSSGMSEDVSMDSPSLGTAATFAMVAGSGESIKGGDIAPPNSATLPHSQGQSQSQQHSQSSQQQQGPSAAEITRRINSKRRREDDFDPVSFKRRAVSPSLSVHNSPVTQSPMQRDNAPWGSRPGSNGGERGGNGSGAPSETGSGSLGGTTPATGGGGATGRANGKGRVGFQGMTDTNDGLMRMSIE